MTPVPPKAWSARLRREHEERQATKAESVTTPTPPEVVAAGERVEVVARALAASDDNDWDVVVETGGADRYRRLAAAAIAADPSPAEEAVKRVEALAADWAQSPTAYRAAERLRAALGQVSK